MIPFHISDGRSSLLSLPIQMLISSGITLTNKPRNNVLPAIWVSLRPVNLTHKINHHRLQSTEQKHLTFVNTVTAALSSLNITLPFHFIVPNMEQVVGGKRSSVFPEDPGSGEFLF